MTKASARLAAGFCAALVILRFLVPGMASTAPAPTAVRIADAMVFGPSHMSMPIEVFRSGARSRSTPEATT